MPRPSRVILVMFALTVMLFGAGMAGGPLGIESAIAASGQPFQTLQDQIDALQAQVDSLIEETSAPLRVFDGEGNDLGLYAGRDGNFDQGFATSPTTARGPFFTMWRGSSVGREFRHSSSAWE